MLDEKLDEVTWSIFTGDLGADIATVLIPGGAIVSSSATLTKWVWNTPPGDLRVKIVTTLLWLWAWLRNRGWQVLPQSKLFSISDQEG